MSPSRPPAARKAAKLGSAARKTARSGSAARPRCAGPPVRARARRPVSRSRSRTERMSPGLTQAPGRGQPARRVGKAARPPRVRAGAGAGPETGPGDAPAGRVPGLAPGPLRDCPDLRRRSAGAGIFGIPAGDPVRHDKDTGGTLADRGEAPGREKTPRVDPSQFSNSLSEPDPTLRGAGSRRNFAGNHRRGQPQEGAFDGVEAAGKSRSRSRQAGLGLWGQALGPDRG